MLPQGPLVYLEVTKDHRIRLPSNQKVNYGLGYLEGESYASKYVIFIYGFDFLVDRARSFLGRSTANCERVRCGIHG